MTPISVTDAEPPICGTISNSPSALKKWSSHHRLRWRHRHAPPCRSGRATSPAVVMRAHAGEESRSAPSASAPDSSATGRAASSWSPSVGAVFQQRIGAGLEPAGVLHARPDAVEPGALIGAARRGEGRARKLLGIEAVGRAAAASSGPAAARRAAPRSRSRCRSPACSARSYPPPVSRQRPGSGRPTSPSPPCRSCRSSSPRSRAGNRRSPIRWVIRPETSSGPWTQRDHLVPGLEHLAAVDALEMQHLEDHLVPVDLEAGRRRCRGWRSCRRGSWCRACRGRRGPRPTFPGRRRSLRSCRSSRMTSLELLA